MKKILSIIAVAAAVTLSGCSKDSENNSFVTLLPSVELKGDAQVFLNLGDSYTDAGADVSIGGEPVSNPDVYSDVNTAEMGIYSVTYSTRNVDGYSASASRTVYVSDLSHKTKWYTPVVLKRDGKDTYPGIVITLEKASDNSKKIIVEDLIGGYYKYGRGYGDEYAVHGSITLSEPDADGWAEIVDFEAGIIESWAEDGPVESITGKFNVNTAEYEWHTKYLGMDFWVK